MFDISSDSDTSVLRTMLRDFRVSAANYCRTEVSRDWGIDLPFQQGLRFHFVARGECWLRAEGHPPLRLAAGDTALLPHGTRHVIAASPDTPAVPLAEVGPRPVTDTEFRISIGPVGEGALIHCCTLVFNDPLAARVVAAMPMVVAYRHDDHDDQRDGGLSAVLALMTRELEADRPGSDTIVARLADVGISMILRDWAETAPERPAWLHPSAHPGLFRAMRALQTEPERRWTVPELAAIAAMSRSTFTAHFNAMAGVSPGKFAVQLRMELADRMLDEGELVLEQIAGRLNYSCGSAFSRAYRDYAGFPPGARRRNGARLAA